MGEKGSSGRTTIGDQGPSGPPGKSCGYSDSQIIHRDMWELICKDTSTFQLCAPLNWSWLLPRQVQWVPRGTASPVLRAGLDSLVWTEQRVKVVILASLVSLGCVVHPCATVALWGGILTAKGQTIDATQRHCRQKSGADVEQTDILRKISSLQLFLVMETKGTSSISSYVIWDTHQN